VPKRETTSLFKAAPLPVAKLNAPEQLACLRLIRSENVGPVTFRELINHYGGAAKALEALPELSRRGGGRRTIRICSKTDAERELDHARKAGATPLFTIEPGYPKFLASVDTPPPLLYIRGREDLLNRPSVAIVGSRMSSAAGIKLAQHFAHDLGVAGYVIVSGMARGIDGAAHEAALQTGTVAVLAGGIDVIYPPEHDKLYARIAEDGCLVSEQPPGFKARSQDFPRRNRIISGIALGVLIVEAAARSGTLVTARFAAEQGREVFAVPGHPLDPRAEGTNRLLKGGATLVTEPEDVLSALSPMSGLSETSLPHHRLIPETPAEPPGPPPEVGDGDRSRILAALGPAPVDIDTIVRSTGLPLRAVQIGLMELELAGRLTRPGVGLIAARPQE
jgi:DNA processing protein